MDSTNAQYVRAEPWYPSSLPWRVKSVFIGVVVTSLWTTD